MSRHAVNHIVAFFALNIAFDLIGLSVASKGKQPAEEDPETEEAYDRITPSALFLVPFTVVYSIICFIISYVVLTLFRTLSLFSAFLRFLGLAAANETKAAMLWSLAAVRSLSGGKADAK